MDHGEALSNIQAAMQLLATSNALTPLQYGQFKQAIDVLVEAAAPAVLAAAEAAKEAAAEVPESNGHKPDAKVPAK